MAKVKCAACGEAIDKKIAMGIPAGKRTKYYCPEHVGMKSPKEEMYDMVFEIFGRKVLNTVLYKELDEIAKVHTYQKMTEYMKENKEYLEKCIYKEFVNEYAQIRYFAAILKNSLTDFVVKKPEVIIQKDIDFCMDVPVNNYKAKKKRKGMDSLLDDL